MTRIISSIPLVGPCWDRLIAWAPMKWCLEEMKLAILYGRPFPSKVHSENSQASIFVDRNDPRGRSVLLSQAKGQRRAKSWFRSACKELQPDIVLDVGANYGEFILEQRFQQNTKVIAVEANPSLVKYLQQSLDSHPNSDQITLIHALAAERSDREQTFYVDPTSSGRSSVVVRNNQCEAKSISTVALDDLFSDRVMDESTLVFKIDVEGYEPFVMSGMTRLLSEPTRRFGIIEFNSELITKAGEDPDEFLMRISAENEVGLLSENAANLKNPTLDDLREIKGSSGNVESDLVIFSDAQLFDRVSAGIKCAR